MKKIYVITTLKNEANLKIAKLIDTYAVNTINVESIGNAIVMIDFTIKKFKKIKNFKRDLELLGVEGKMLD